MNKRTRRMRAKNPARVASCLCCSPEASPPPCGRCQWKAAHHGLSSASRRGAKVMAKWERLGQRGLMRSRVLPLGKVATRHAPPYCPSTCRGTKKSQTPSGTVACKGGTTPPHSRNGRTAAKTVRSAQRRRESTQNSAHRPQDTHSPPAFSTQMQKPEASDDHRPAHSGGNHAAPCTN